MTAPPSKEQEKIMRLRSDYSYFAPNEHYIETKDPEIPLMKFKFNTAQKYLHLCVLAMLFVVGFVRIIVVKGRQQGISTYIEGLLHWLAILNPYKRVSIISHEAKSTQTIFEKLQTFNETCSANIKPELVKDNEKRLEWTNKSRVSVFTAGSKDTARSSTSHYQHQSERAYFENPAAIDAGAGQTIGRFKNTYVFRESTANGYNHFEKEVQNGWIIDTITVSKVGGKLKYSVTFANEGKSDYWVVFIPWYWQKEYRADTPPGFKPTPEELELLEAYGPNGLTDFEQLQWRRLKIAELDAEVRGNGAKWFKQEYPNCLDEAFQESGDPYIEAALVQRAINNTHVTDNISPRILGVDCARRNDNDVYILRQGAEHKKTWTKDNKHVENPEVVRADTLADIIDNEGIDKCFIDYAHGSGTIDLLRSRGYGDIVEGVWFNETPSKEIFGNKRAEMYVSLRDWLRNGAVKLLNDAKVKADILAIREPEDRGGKFYFEDKKEMRKRIGRSPDYADALALTFARKVRGEHDGGKFSNRTENTKRGSSLTARARVVNNKVDYNDYDDNVNTGFTKVPTRSKFRRT